GQPGAVPGRDELGAQTRRLRHGSAHGKEPGPPVQVLHRVCHREQSLRRALLERRRVRQLREPLLLERERLHAREPARGPDPLLRPAPHPGRPAVGSAPVMTLPSPLSPGSAARRPGPRSLRATVRALLALSVLSGALEAIADVPVPVPQPQRSRSDAERSGFHDAANIRTVYWNFGMVGDYPADPANVDLSVFHSCEVPKGSGMNYSDGITPFVLAKIRTVDGQDVYLMETGYRERQAT